MKYLSAILLLALGACSGSPVAVSRLSPQELAQVPDAQLCRAYTSTSPLRAGGRGVDLEVARRGMLCGHDTATADLMMGAALLQSGAATYQTARPGVPVFILQPR